MKFPEGPQRPDYLELQGLYPRRRRIPNWPIGLWIVVLMVAAIPVVGLPGVVLARYTTSNSNFCLNCHATGETPDRSVRSEVHPDFDRVTCVDCHAKPGQIVFEGYYKGFQAEPERVSGNCVRCHATITERSDQKDFKFNVRNITITHKEHLERGASCVSCHSNVAHDLETPSTNRPTMESCYSCHARTDSCMKCHAGGIPPAPTQRETVSRRPVAPPMAASSPPVATVGAEGKALYAKACAACHGADGSSLPSTNLKSKSYLESKGAEALMRATAEGKGGMPPFGVAKGGSLEDEQVKAIVDYLISAAN